MAPLFRRAWGWLESLFAPTSGVPAGPSALAIETNECGLLADKEGDFDAAEAAYLEAALQAPDWVSPWFNLGILYKKAARWEDAARVCRRALELDPSSEGARWNLGIATTALGLWTEAREAWRACGIRVPDGDGPLEMKLGQVPVRVNPAENPEVVWCERLDPARAVVRSIPMPACGRRYGDLVLHDGAPKGWRMLGEREVPVFEELAVLVHSRSSTFVAEVEVPTPADAEALEAMLSARGLVSEDWTVQVRMLCAECSEGRPHACSARHEPAPPSWETQHRVGITAENEAQVHEALADWEMEGPGRACLRIERAVEGVLPV